MDHPALMAEVDIHRYILLFAWSIIEQTFAVSVGMGYDVVLQQTF